MKIIDSYNDKGCVFYTVELAPAKLIDIKVVKQTGLIYVMQNHDGSHVYLEADPDTTFPKYLYDEKAAIALVAARFKEESKNG